MKNTEDFTVHESGEAFISQRKTAKLCGVGQDSISRYISNLGIPLKSNDLNQLNHKGLLMVLQYYAFESQRPTKKSLDSYRKIVDNNLYNLKKVGAFDFNIGQALTKKKKVGYVYVIRCNDFYKIGKANNVKSRLEALQTATPYALELILTFKTKYPLRLESHLHYHFRNQNVRGEWFTLSDNDLKLIKEKKMK